MALVTLVNLSVTIAYYGYLIPLSNKYIDNNDNYSSFDQRYEYYWGDYAIITASVVLFPAYLYSIWGKKPLASNKYARAVLMLLPALFLIGVQLRFIDLMIKLVNSMNEKHPGHQATNPFSCANSDGSVSTPCSLLQCHIFVPVVVGFFVIVEVAVTLFRGPLHSSKEAYL